MDDPLDFFTQMSHYSGVKGKNGEELSLACHGQSTPVRGSNLADYHD